MKFLYLPNECDETDFYSTQVGPRKAFASLQTTGEIEQLEICSFLHAARKKGESAAKRELLCKAESYRPDTIFWQHVGKFPVDDSFVSELRRRSRCKLLVYHESDVFDGIAKRLGKSARAIAKQSDLTLICGLGPLRELFQKNGARNVRYLPHHYDNVRFGQDWSPTRNRKYKVTMIAGRYRLFHTPFLYLPGGRRRAQFAARLSREFKDDFALYGSGWTTSDSYRGALPFKDQGHVIRNSWITANWDHYDEVPYYFSDRLPISLAAGVPHVTSYHPGYEQIFADCNGLYYAKTVADALEIVEWLLSRPRDMLIEEGLKAQQWVRANLEADAVFKRAFEYCQEEIARKAQS